MKEKYKKKQQHQLQKNKVLPQAVKKTERSFLQFIKLKESKKFIWITLTVSIIYFIILRNLYPVPSFYSDSYTYLQAARDNVDTSFRPIQYSRILTFFKNFSSSDVALIFGQYFSNVAVNLFLFFTCTYFFAFNKINTIVVYALLILNPLYLFYSNYILSDSFFCSFTVLWFTLAIWILHRPKWYYIVAQLLLLIILFKLRYNAIIFPLIMAVPMLLSKQKPGFKFISIAAGFIIIFLLINSISLTTERDTGTKTFSPFSGWQMANNALHVLRTRQPVNEESIDDNDVKDVLNYMKHFFDTATHKFDNNAVSISYLWDKDSPLKNYVNVYAAKNNLNSYFETWCALGPVYSDFGKTIILKNPGLYFTYFILPNTKGYFYPILEAYENYNVNTDTVQEVASSFYDYKTNKASSQHSWVYSIFFKPWQTIFLVVNIIIILGSVAFYVTKKYKKQSQLFNKTLLSFLFFYSGNFFFIVILAPSVFRYHVFILTLAFPLMIYLLQQLIRPVQQNLLANAAT